MAVKILCDFCDKELTEEDLKDAWYKDPKDGSFPNLINSSVMIKTRGPKGQLYFKELLLCQDCKEDMNLRVRMLKEFIEGKMYRPEKKTNKEIETL